MENFVKTKKRNSLIEFYRFFFAFNVVIGHGLFPIDTPFFGPDRISVEFFFVLSGFLFFHSLEKYKNMSIKSALVGMVVSKTKPLLIPTVIGLVSNAILNYITNYNPLKVFRYLWYIPAMLITFAVITILRVYIKNDRKFFITVAMIGLVATVMRFSGSEVLFFFDYARSSSAISLGILFRKLPKINFKRKALVWLLLLPVLCSTLYIVVFGLAKDSKLFEAILDLILYPLLIYITFNIDFRFSLFNYLGGLSFGIYAFQCPARLVANLGVGNRWIPFLLIIVMAVGEDIIKRLIKYHKSIRNNT